MKRFFTLVVMLFGFFAVNAQSTGAAPELLLLKETEHNFGEIPQHKPVYYTFEVTNNGSTPLKLDNVQATCGCTTPEWSRDAIAPGSSSKIRVGFNAAQEGPFTKDITIVFNGDQTRKLVIHGNVWKAPEGAAPANASVQFLKKQSL